MRFGFVMPFGNAADIADAAVLAESAGWDAIFVWEPVWGVDAWVSLTAAAMVTKSIRLGTMLTPLPRVRPWDLASKVATLDRLSGGRVQLAVGLGAVHDGWTAFEADEGRTKRVELLDEGLAVYDGLMRGQPFSYDGRHHHVRPTDFFVPDPPVQQPRVPVWVVGAYRPGFERQPSVDRAARWDGILPYWIDPKTLAPLTMRRLATRARPGWPRSWPAPGPPERRLDWPCLTSRASTWSTKAVRMAQIRRSPRTPMCGPRRAPRGGWRARGT